MTDKTKIVLLTLLFAVAVGIVGWSPDDVALDTITGAIGGFVAGASGVRIGLLAARLR